MGTDEMIQEKTSKSWLILLVSISLILVLMVTAVLFLLVINEFIVEVRVAGDPSITLEYGEHYQEPGATAVLRGSMALTEGVQIDVQTQGQVNDFCLGEYQILYKASMGPWSGTSQRTVTVMDTKAPVITVFSNDQTTTQPGQEYREEGYLAVDNYDGDITDKVEVTRGENTVTYTVTDSSGNTAAVTREIRYAQLPE